MMKNYGDRFCPITCAVGSRKPLTPRLTPFHYVEKFCKIPLISMYLQDITVETNEVGRLKAGSSLQSLIVVPFDEFGPLSLSSGESMEGCNILLNSSPSDENVTRSEIKENVKTKNE
ncbi:hypothetical protein Bhyg_07839 [Pseudolycoriella hygida]|uniref:Uncharacterized protein n=1 Tax=Pseudolycoriella hygida TaxID=35572 RepID=A0A9Q0S3R3_9DIPT|nr:hypothetical protein Bhyg_07839 [Pseudolycoriella hygida]